MNITVKRQTSNQLYTEGRLLVNDLKTTHTVESTADMLPAGEYVIRLSKDKSRRRVIGIFSFKDEGLKMRDEGNSLNSNLSTFNLHYTNWSIGIGHSWIGSRKHQVIAIGDVLIPGAVFKASETYERLFDRIEKCEQRGEPITLIIDELQCIENTPIKHWTTAY